MKAPTRLAELKRTLPTGPCSRIGGRVRRLLGITLEAEGVPGEIGHLCYVKTSRGDVPVEVVGFHDEHTLLLPLRRLDTVRPGAEIFTTGGPMRVGVGPTLLGRVVDGFGEPIDGNGAIAAQELRSWLPNPPNALDRQPIQTILETGVCAIDLALTVGKGQRIGIFAGSGVGKSTLLGMLMQQAKADVVVLALIGERGREVRQFIDQFLDPVTRHRSVVVAATSDRSALERMRAAHVAATVAEYYRDQGQDVLLVMDSATRFAMALREAGLAAGEPPTNRGYPPSLYSEMPRLVERFGTSAKGSVTALLTVLMEGDDMADPAADCLRALLDGHVILTRSLAERGHYPPIDLLQSLSRLMQHIVDKKQLRAAQTLRSWLAMYEEYRDLIEVGAYRTGSEPKLDRIIALLPEIHSLLTQDAGQQKEYSRELQTLFQLVDKGSVS